MILLSIMGTQQAPLHFFPHLGRLIPMECGCAVLFRLPLAMIVISAVFVPFFSASGYIRHMNFLNNVSTLKTRSFTAFSFLVRRGLSYGNQYLCTLPLSFHFAGMNYLFDQPGYGWLLIIYTVSGVQKPLLTRNSCSLLSLVWACSLPVMVVICYLWVAFKTGIKYGGRLGKMNIITNGATQKVSTE
jgi:hypothetical protein